MDTKHYWLMAIAALVLLTVILAVFWARKQTALDKDLASCGWTLYLMRGCSHCERQKLLLMGLHGGYSASAEYASDGTLLSSGLGTPPPIPFKSIKGFPLWHNTKTGAETVGYQDEAALKKMAKC